MQHEGVEEHLHDGNGACGALRVYKPIAIQLERCRMWKLRRRNHRLLHARDACLDYLAVLRVLPPIGGNDFKNCWGLFDTETGVQGVQEPLTRLVAAHKQITNRGRQIAPVGDSEERVW
jgi:hypothetical protein